MSKKIFLAVLALLGLAFPQAARGQFIGYTSPQTVRSVVANAVTCPGGGVGNTITIPNLGQTTHFVTYTTTGTPSSLSVQINALEGGVSFPISDVSQQIPSGVITANGYYSIIQVSYNCTGNGGSITVVYYGGSAISVPTTGTQDQAAYSKTLMQNQTSAVAQNLGVVTPYGSMCGQLHFNNNSVVAGTLVSVQINENGASQTVVPSTAVASSGDTILHVPCIAARSATVSVTPGGVGNYQITYDFFKPGQQGTADPCQNPGIPKSSAVVTAPAAATTQIIAGIANQQIFVCGYNVGVVTAVAGTLQWTTGTGGTCGANTVTKTGAIPVNVAEPFSYGPGSTLFTAALGSGVCITLTGAGDNGAGIVTFVQQ